MPWLCCSLSFEVIMLLNTVPNATLITWMPLGDTPCALVSVVNILTGGWADLVHQHLPDLIIKMKPHCFF